MPRLIAVIIRVAACLVPVDVRADWRREWEAELAWARAQGRSRATQLGRALGAWPHALWLRTDRWRWDVIGHDIRYAARALWQRPVFATTAMLSLALGIGANVAIFTVVNGVLLRPLPFPDAGRLIQLANGDGAATLSGPELVDLTRDARTLTAVGAYAFSDANVTGGSSNPERVRVARVTAGFFTALATPPVTGRAFTADEDRPGAPDVVVVSEGLWSRYAGGAPADGRRIIVNGTPRTVVGVMPADFDFPASSVELWVPLALSPAAPGERRNHNYRVIARLAGGAGVAAAQSEVETIKAVWRTRFPDLYSSDRPLVADVVPIADRLLGGTRPYFVAMLGAVALVLLIACVNVASLLLIFGEARRKDLAICAAMGATRARLARRAMAESLVLSAGGAAIGILVALPASRVLVALAPASIPRLTQVHLDGAVLAFSAVVSLVTALVSGAAPLVRAYRDTDAAMLRSAGRSGDPGGGRGTRRTHAVLVAGQVALAVTMLAGAGYFSRSLLRLQHSDLGYDPAGVLTARLTLPHGSYDEARAATTVEAIVERLRQAPGVAYAAAMAWTPIVDGGGMWSIASDAAPPDATNGESPVAAPQQVTPDFFRALSIPILRGRAFTTADTGSSELVSVVNESFARLLWGTVDPIGRRFRMLSDTAKWITVVGLVPDTRVDGLTDAKPPVMYFPHAQAGVSAYFTSLGMTLTIRHTGDPAPLVAEIRHVLRATDPDVPLSDIRGLEEVVGASIARERFTTVLVSGFAIIAALLTGVGMYGAIAYGVAQRRFEIGVRMALGAATGRIMADVVRRGVLIAGAGLAAGLVGAVAVGRLLRSVLFGAVTFDAGVLGLVSLVLLAVAVAALAIPARRAMRVNPTEALRSR